MPNATKRQVEAWWFVLRSERQKPKEEQSRFLLNPLSQAQRMAVFDDSVWASTDTDGRKVLSSRGAQQAYALCLSQIVEVQNFPLDAPKAWPKEGSKKEKESYLEMLNDLDVFEVGNAIRERATLEPEAKNS